MLSLSLLGFSSTTETIGSSSSLIGSIGSIGSTGSFVILIFGFAFALDFDLTTGFALCSSSSMIASITVYLTGGEGTLSLPSGGS